MDDRWELALLFAPFALIFVFLGFVLVHTGSYYRAFKAECFAQGGTFIAGGRGPDLCVKDGLIIMPKGETE